MEMIPENIIDAARAENWKVGEVHRRAKLALATELLDLPEDKSGFVETMFMNVVDMLESPIEQVALAHMLGRNYVHYLSSAFSAAVAYRSFPDEWPDRTSLLIVPQVSFGRRRADFVVYLRNGRKFAVECDGKEFHDSIDDGFRDAALLKDHLLPVLRYSGKEIWESPLWSNQVKKMVLMLEGQGDLTHG